MQVKAQPCPLEAMLAARDDRRRRQAEHFRSTPQLTLLVATIVAPGQYKLTDRTLRLAEEQRRILKATFFDKIVGYLETNFITGPETWLKLSCSAEDAKRLATRIEDTHPVGRLFDLDIILPDLSPLPRTQIGLKPRSCLLCENDARVCMRAHTHNTEDIETEIERLYGLLS